MHDWNALVCKQLGGLGLNPAQQEEVVAEIAGHLQDIYEEGCAHGLCKTEAMERSLGEVADWRRLARKIQRTRRKEEGMNNRIKNLWLPSCTSLAPAMGFLMLLQRTGPQPRLVWLGSMPLMLYVPWLVALPLFGAAGAYLSRRAGGPRLARVVAGLFPAIVILGLAVLGVSSSLVVEPNVFILHHPAYLAFALFNWVVLPAAALLLGAVPFLNVPKPREF